MTITGHIVLIDATPGPDFERDNTPVTYHIPTSRVQRVYQLPDDPWWRLVLDGKYAIITKDESKVAELMAGFGRRLDYDKAKDGPEGKARAEVGQLHQHHHPESAND